MGRPESAIFARSVRNILVRICLGMTHPPPDDLDVASQGNVQAVDHHFLTFEGEYSNSERIRLPTGIKAGLGGTPMISTSSEFGSDDTCS